MGATRSDFNAQTVCKLIFPATICLGFLAVTSLPPVLVATMAVALYAAIFAPDLLPKLRPVAALA